MKITDRLRLSRSRGVPSTSYEFFPPKTHEGEEALAATIHTLASKNPSFVSVTYGAGGSSRPRTIRLVTELVQRREFDILAHFASIGHSADEVAEILTCYADAGIENVLALRGDPPRDSGASTNPSSFRFANELIDFIKRIGFDFCVGAAAYPEGHVQCSSKDEDFLNLLRKVDAGADFLVTQMFFDNRVYFDFLERLARARVTIPVIPGILPVSSAEQISKMAAMCGASVPRDLHALVSLAKDDPSEVAAIGLEHALSQCKELLANGAPGIHIYTLNRAPAAARISDELHSAALAGNHPQSAASAKASEPPCNAKTAGHR